MTLNRQQEILIDAVDTFGAIVQTAKALEELGELQTELSRLLVHCMTTNTAPEPTLIANIQSEIADVIIMCIQLQIINGDCSHIIEQKIERLEKLVKQKKEITMDFTNKYTEQLYDCLQNRMGITVARIADIIECEVTTYSGLQKIVFDTCNTKFTIGDIDYMDIDTVSFTTNTMICKDKNNNSYTFKSILGGLVYEG